MHTWTVTCDPAVAEESGTAATELDAVVAGTAALRRLLRATHQMGQDSPFVQLSIDTRPRIGIGIGADGPDTVFEWIDDYAYEATLAAAVDDSILARTHLGAS
ncbi:hypothetical protein [Rhodococcus sp. LW-XY12]|uniref:hypothetical protein n=1 Tax=Rhodococcus sp. LW-XY12 TaxID=2856851 RepID=UPI001C5660DD|nr:hypothetical protein [Rhodococcus sp. LW-XY12]QXU56575.1 hypothetical protein KXC42_25975 [Rhodococcus sp. LW-XY12]